MSKCFLLNFYSKLYANHSANTCLCVKINLHFLKVGAVMASLMAESLDVASENFLKPTKYDKLTSLSKTLRDDPSCQLCTILVKYMMKLDMLADIGKFFLLKGVSVKMR